MARLFGNSRGRALLAGLVSASLVLSVSGCGGGEATGTAGSVTQPPFAGSAIAAFGRPATRPVQAQVSADLRRFFVALAADDGGAACSHLGRLVRSQIVGLVSPGSPGTSCPAALSSMFAGEAAQTRAAQRQVHVKLVRFAPRRGFVIYEEPGVPVQFFPLVPEGGRWKLGAIGGSELPR